MNVIWQFVCVPLFFYHRENVKLSENQKNKDLNKNKIKDLCVICEKRGEGNHFSTSKTVRAMLHAYSNKEEKIKEDSKSSSSAAL